MTNIFAPTSFSDYETTMAGWRSRFVGIALRTSALAGIIPLAFALNSTLPLPIKVVYIFLYIVVIIFSISQLSYNWRAGLLLVAMSLFSVGSFIISGYLGLSQVLLISLIIFSTILFSNRAGIYAIAFSLLIFLSFGWNAVNGKTPSGIQNIISTTTTDWLLSAAVFLLISIILYGLLVFLQREIQITFGRNQDSWAKLTTSQRALDKLASDRSYLLNAISRDLNSVNTIMAKIASINDIGQLLQITVNSLGKEFNYHHVGLYIVDTQGGIAYLQAASSDEGKQLIVRGYQISLQDDGILQNCIKQKQQQLSNLHRGGSTRDERYFYMPQTITQAVFPVMFQDAVIAALDLQSTQVNAFQQFELYAIQILANYLGVAISNTRLIKDAQAKDEQLRVADETRIQASWLDLIKRKNPSYQYTPLAVQKIDISSDQRSDKNALVIPILLREKMIGEMQFKRKSTGTGWLEEEKIMASEVASQIALALENARLLEDAQTRASKERTLGEIATRIGAAMDVESILRTTVQEIGKAIGDSEVTVQLNPEGAES